jgi:hypothetical protein
MTHIHIDPRPTKIVRTYRVTYKGIHVDVRITDDRPIAPGSKYELGERAVYPDMPLTTNEWAELNAWLNGSAVVADPDSLLTMTDAKDWRRQ